MKTLATIISLFLLFASCSNGNTNPDKARPHNSNNQVENFEVFFEKFSSDSVFQKSRIKFPLPAETYDIDKGSYLKSATNAAEWSFFNIKELDRKILTTSKEKDQNTVNIQIEDTGVSVDYIFRKQGNKWKLTKIVDSST
jgi:hypothetical protein